MKYTNDQSLVAELEERLEGMMNNIWKSREGIWNGDKL